MARIVLRGSILRVLLLLASCVLASAFFLTPIALAQHGGGGGHGGGGHFGGGAHMSAPHGSALASSHGASSRARGAMMLPRARFGAGSFRFRPRPIHPHPFPIFGYPVFFGAPFFWYGGFNSFWWPPCGPFWGPGCNFSPFYGYGYDYGNDGEFYSPGGQGAAPGYEYPPYLYGEGARDLAELFFKDGTVYDVTDYWLVDGQIHFTTVDEQGTKSVEHVRSFDALDLQTTIDVNTQRGFRFTLRNVPMEQYFREHPEVVPKVDPEAPRN